MLKELSRLIPILDLFQTEVQKLSIEPDRFEALAMEIFRFQAEQNPVYSRFLYLLGCESRFVSHLEEIPFLPISFFKNQEIKTGEWQAETWFQSSGTSKQQRSRHFVRKLAWYHYVSAQIFKSQIGDLQSFQILGLLPTYLENPHSSLIEMVQSFMKSDSNSRQFLSVDFESFESDLAVVRQSGLKPLIFSVTYALRKLMEEKPMDLSDCVVIETGGMKGMGSEIPKIEMYDLLRNNLKIKQLYSEYGMTEMLSQSYSDDGIYVPGYSMRVLVRQLEDPLSGSSKTGRGGLNIIDLANMDTCSFIATDDVGQVFDDQRFEVFGRVDGSEIRGCNLLFAN